MRKVISLLVLGVIVLFASNASASIAPALPPASYPVAGEADLTYTLGDTTYTVYVDWIVDYFDTGWGEDDGAVYVYLYQVENMLGTGDIIDEFSILPVLGIIDEYGWAEQAGAAGHTVDLDSGLSGESDFSYNHNVASFGNLSGENEPAAGESIESVESATILEGLLGRKMEWNFNGGVDGIESGDESDTVWLTSSVPPVYTPAYADNTFKLTGHVPAPMPEPSSMLLLGMGLFGFAGRTIRKRFKA